MKIWYRHLLSRLTTTFLFFLFCFFAIYTIVDLSVHGVRFLSHGATTFLEIARYYLHEFANHLGLFLPLTLLIASIKVLLDLNAHNELVALQMAGISKKKVLRPFFLFASLLTLVAYANSQWLAPDAQDASYAFKTLHSKKKKKKAKREHISNIALEDDTELVYQSFDEEKNELFDVFWIKSAGDVWHMKFLNIGASPIEGRFVDHLKRNDLGQFEKFESFSCLPFPDLPWNADAVLEKFVPFENRPLITLLSQATALTADRQTVFSHLHYKIALPLLPFFILIAVSPAAMRFSRTRSSLLILAISLFTFIGLMTILDGMLILGENQVIPGYLAIWGPFALLLACTLPRFAKL